MIRRLLSAGIEVENIFILSASGLIATPASAYVSQHTDCVGVSRLERLGVEGSLVELTQRFKKIPAPAARR